MAHRNNDGTKDLHSYTFSVVCLFVHLFATVRIHCAMKHTHTHKTMRDEVHSTRAAFTSGLLTFFIADCYRLHCAHHVCCYGIILYFVFVFCSSLCISFFFFFAFVLFFDHLVWRKSIKWWRSCQLNSKYTNTFNSSSLSNDATDWIGNCIW